MKSAKAWSTGSLGEEGGALVHLLNWVIRALAFSRRSSDSWATPSKMALLKKRKKKRGGEVSRTRNVSFGFAMGGFLYLGESLGVLVQVPLSEGPLEGGEVSAGQGFSH